MLASMNRGSLKIAAIILGIINIIGAIAFFYDFILLGIILENKIAVEDALFSMISIIITCGLFLHIINLLRQKSPTK